MSLTELRSELAAQAAEMDGRAFDPLPGARRQRHRIVLRRRLAATAGGLALLAGFLTSLPDDARDLPAPPVAGYPDQQPGWPAVKPPISVGRPVTLAPDVTLRFETASTVAITLPRGFEPGVQTVRRAFSNTGDKDQWLYAGRLSSGEGHAILSIPLGKYCPPAVARGQQVERVRIRVALDGQVPRMYWADVYPIAFNASRTLAYLRYPLRGFVMTPGNAGPRDAHGVFLSYEFYLNPCGR